MAGKRPALVMFRSTSIAAVRAPDEVVMTTNFEDQAKAICGIMVNALPAAVLDEFTRATGADKEVIFDIGMSFTAPSPPNKTKRGLNCKLSPAAVRDIKQHLEKKTLAPCALAEKHGVALSTIYRIRQGATWTQIP